MISVSNTLPSSRETKHDHFVTYGNIKSRCYIPGTNNSVGQLHFRKKLTEKEIRFVVTRGRG